MKQLTLFFALNFLLVLPDKSPTVSFQDSPYLCAANTLAMNTRLCIDITEVPGYMYKDYLASVAKEEGLNSPSFTASKPDFEKWASIFEKLDQREIEEKFFDSDEFALMPLIGVSKKQAEAFCQWRTEALKEKLSRMSKRERAQFPKKFVFRLPTANEWSRMRFLVQKKPMMKRLDKIANANMKAFKYSKAKLVKDNGKITHVYGAQDSKVGFFNLFDNVAEMTSEEGLAVGGSWFEANESNDYQQTYAYTGAEAWLGFRCIFEIIE